jgi:hypothetical protein
MMREWVTTFSLVCFVLKAINSNKEREKKKLGFDLLPIKDAVGKSRLREMQK